MPCYSPLTIKSNKTKFNAVTDKLYNTFPCGKCGGCRTDKQDSWSIRTYYEWLRCKRNNGFGLFTTFTYNDDSLPYVIYDNCQIPVFSKTHVRTFFDSFRFNLDKLFGETFNFRYILFSEYGGLKHRPHYHANFFFDGVSESKVNLIKHIIRKTWKHGFVYYSKTNGGIINSPASSLYITKYITKDIDFYNDTMNDYLKELRYIHDDDAYKIIKNEILPFHLQSKFFGLYASEFIDENSLISGRMVVPSVKSSTFTTKPLPLYYKRKLLYYLDDDNSYQLTRYGCDIMQKRETNLRESLQLNFQHIIDNLKTYCNQDSIDSINCILGTRYTNYIDLSSKFDFFRNQFTLTELVDYVVDLRNTVSVTYDLFERANVPTYQNRYNYNNRLLPPEPYNVNDSHDFRHLNKYLLNGYPVFRDLDAYYSLFTAVKVAIGKQQNAFYFNQYQRKQKTKRHVNY